MKLEENNFKSKFSKLWSRIRNTIYKFSLTEKVIFGLFLSVLLISLFASFVKINARYMVEIPQRGGELKEGLIGTPRFINPVIAISDTDRDITSLVYSGLLKVNSEGKLIPDLAESFTVSEDGLKYSIKIKDDASFHDGKPLTVDDIIFTINKTQDPAIKSPKRPNWDGVIIEKIDDKNIDFTLSQSYYPFAYNLTMGILPKHIWEKIPAEEFAFSKYNLEPIGSGPFEIQNVKKDSDGIAKKYTLKSFNHYTLGEPFISKIYFSFYKNEEDLLTAIEKGVATSAHSLSPQNLLKIENDKILISAIPFSRVFALFLNQGQSEVLADKVVREVLNKVAPRKEIVEKALGNHAIAIDSPVINSDSATLEETPITDAQKILEDNGWTKDDKGIYQKVTKSKTTRLSFTITTANIEELVTVSEIVAKKYKELGAEVDVKIFEPNDLTINVIRPREFQSILFGQVINRDMDLYAFWHSSQRNDPGLNIAGFTNIEADKDLEKIRSSSDDAVRQEALQKFGKEVINDIPAIFLYSPDFIYVVPDNLKFQKPTNIVTSSDRFADIEKWYIDTDMVWKIFAK